MRSVLSILLLVAAASAAPALQAQQGPKPGTIELKNVAEMEVTEAGADGKPVVKRVPVQKAVPGTQVLYTTTFRNIGTQPASDIAINNAIPPSTTLVSGSAFGDNTSITFSADGGKTFAPVDKVRVRGADGKERPAALSEFTHIRWTYRTPLPAGAVASAGFRVTIN